VRRALRQADPRIAVTLVEANATFTACPFSNAVSVACESCRAAVHVRARRGRRYRHRPRDATAVDAQARSVTLADGARLSYDRLVLAPGIDIRWGALPGYDEAAAAQMPHAWKRRADAVAAPSVEAMDDGGLVVISARRIRSAAHRGPTSARA